MNLELKHLAPYLPYGLKLRSWHECGEYHINTLCDQGGLSNTSLSTLLNEQNEFYSYKPILRPLSDLAKDELNIKILSWFEKVTDPKVTVYKNKSDYSITVTYKLMGEVFTDIIVNRGVCDDTRYWIMNELFKNHYDVFGLIPNDLAIDINTVSS